MQVALVIAVLAVGLSAWFIMTRDTLESVASRSFDSITAADGATFMRLMSPEERSALGLNKEQWTRFLTDYVRPELDKWTHVAEPNYEYSSESEALASTHRFLSPFGRTAGLRVEVGRTMDGPRSTGLVKNLITLVASMKYGRNYPKNKVGLFYSMRDLCALDGAALDGLRLHGTYNVTRKQIEPWAELGETLGGIVERYEKRMQGTPKQ